MRGEKRELKKRKVAEEAEEEKAPLRSLTPGSLISYPLPLAERPSPQVPSP